MAHSDADDSDTLRPVQPAQSAARNVSTRSDHSADGLIPSSEISAVTVVVVMVIVVTVSVIVLVGVAVVVSVTVVAVVVVVVARFTGADTRGGG